MKEGVGGGSKGAGEGSREQQEGDKGAGGGIQDQQEGDKGAEGGHHCFGSYSLRDAELACS